MSKFILLVLAVIMGTSFLSLTLAPIVAQAQSGSELVDQLNKSAGPSGANLASPVDPRYIVMRAIQTLLGLVGLMLVGLIVYGGVLWITAGGNSEQTGMANKYIFNAVLGLLLIIFAFTITAYIYRFAMSSQSSGCTSNKECGSRSKCNRYSQCVNQLWCEADADCARGEICAGNVCQKPYTFQR